MDIKSTILATITEVSVLEGLRSLNMQPFQAKANEIWYTTRCHGGDSHKLCMYRDSLQFYCYTNCGMMDIFSLVEHVCDCSFGESVQFWKRILGIKHNIGFNRVPSASSICLPDDYRNLRKRKKLQNAKLLDSNSIPEIVTYSESLLNYFENDWYCGQWLDEGITEQSMQKYEISWYETGQSVIIPHRNKPGALVGIRRRSLREEDIVNGCKYMPLILEGRLYNHSLGTNLYGLYQSQEAIKKYKRVVIVESEKSVLLSDSYYGENSYTVATCGFNVSNTQRDMLLSLGVEEVILGFDKDYEPLDFIDYNASDETEIMKFDKFQSRIESIAHKFSSFCRVYVLWDNMKLLQKKDSPLDRGKEVFEELMRNKTEIFCKGSE